MAGSRDHRDRAAASRSTATSRSRAERRDRRDPSISGRPRTRHTRTIDVSGGGGGGGEFMPPSGTTSRSQRRHQCRQHGGRRIRRRDLVLRGRGCDRRHRRRRQPSTSTPRRLLMRGSATDTFGADGGELDVLAGGRVRLFGAGMVIRVDAATNLDGSAGTSRSTRATPVPTAGSRSTATSSSAASSP